MNPTPKSPPPAARLLLVLFLTIGLAQTSSAHSGHHSEVNITFQKNGLSVVLRFAPELAWLLPEARPAGGPLAKAFAEATPIFEKTAPTLVTLKAGKKRLQPTSVRVLMEPDRHVAFVLKFDHGDGPLSLRADFLSRLGQQEHVTAKVYDHSSAERTATPFARLELDDPGQLVEFSKESAKILSTP